MSQEIRNKIAKKVQELRTSKNLKREELSLLLGFDNSYISKLEKGNINITIDRLCKIAKHFDVDIKELL
jgi:transcriptional regulator with XRE-family HTH domain